MYKCIDAFGQLPIDTALEKLRRPQIHKMASMYTDVSESEEFLSNIDADQLLSLLSQDGLNAPSETFVFKSVLEWIKHKKEERSSFGSGGRQGRD